MAKAPEQWGEIYAANEAIWQAEEPTARSKQNAWRTQRILLAQATRHLNDAIHNAVTKEHFDKLETGRSSEEIVKQRVERCQQIIKGSRRCGSRQSLVFRMPSSSVFEPACRGTYESCQHNEMALRDLHKLLAPSGTNENASRNSVAHFPATGRLVSAETATNPNKGVHLNNTRSCSTVSASASAEESDPNWFGFRTAREQQSLDDLKKKNPQGVSAPSDIMNYRKKTLGGRRTVHSNYVPPTLQGQGQNDNRSKGSSSAGNIPASLSHLDAQMVEQIMGESMHNFKNVAWEDIAGLESAKSTFLEAIILPLRRPDLFTGVRCPPRGVLLFGPPGTGKTLIAKSIASQAKAKFFSINPSTLTSKWVGEAEKLVKTLFAVAVAHQPSIIFIDEVDSLLSKRSGNENESTLRLKNEFLIHLDGAATNDEHQILVIGATNRPQELDEAVRRRFVRRLYVPLPTKEARQQIIEKILAQVKHSLSSPEINELAELTDGYSGADVDSLCRYASMAPLRSLTNSQMEVIQPHQLPAVTMDDFKKALKVISKSVSPEDCQRFAEWNEIYGIRH
ncbi:fidgetin-like protein 1 isoform X2 [Drosophila pseudoobscura]|uniref:Fidgetin-like protein 1 isoform X2 n=1 Tax=Drosophila pseudoobscura pseudoobscura TaxID=46245 RepID=A0A6I8W0Z2_DROPS|nr:fidgetin-like protein 1 isoform X2 [Drosophila pseudoobscura]